MTSQDIPPSSAAHILAASGAQTDFSQSMSYGDYLALDSLLAALHPRSPDHNDMLFIIQHQTSYRFVARC
jgi:tryptophan 2,3-dioxygenase